MYIVNAPKASGVAIPTSEKKNNQNFTLNFLSGINY